MCHHIQLVHVSHVQCDILFNQSTNLSNRSPNTYNDDFPPKKPPTKQNTNNKKQQPPTTIKPTILRISNQDKDLAIGRFHGVSHLFNILLIRLVQERFWYEMSVNLESCSISERRIEMV